MENTSARDSIFVLNRFWPFILCRWSNKRLQKGKRKAANKTTHQILYIFLCVRFTLALSIEIFFFTFEHSFLRFTQSVYISEYIVIIFRISIL